MWPRSSDRGKRAIQENDSTLELELQCGHGPRTVENASLPVMGDRGQVLQCGHGPRTVENGTGDETSGRCSSASMWPRSSDRGKPAICLLNTPKRGVLQCGHGPRTVEN